MSRRGAARVRVDSGSVRALILSLLVVAMLVVAALFFIPGPINKTFLLASVERASGSGGSTFGSGKGKCVHGRPDHWRCRVPDKKNATTVLYAVRITDGSCWRARLVKKPKGVAMPRQVKDCVHLVELHAF